MRRALPWLIAALGGVLAVAGVAVFASANSSGVGWAGYMGEAPLEPITEAYQSDLILFSDGAVLWTRQHALGAVLVVLGLLVLAGFGGWLLGRRRARGSTLG